MRSVADRERGEQRSRLEDADRPVARVVLQRWRVGEEDRVERAGLGDAGELDVVLDVDRVERVRLGQPPRCLVVADVVEERVEVEESSG